MTTVIEYDGVPVGSGGVDEAPADGRAYLRQDGEWQAVVDDSRALFDPTRYGLPASGDTARVSVQYDNLAAARAAYGVPWLELSDTLAYASLQSALWAAWTYTRHFRLQVDGVPLQARSGDDTVADLIPGTWADLAAAQAATGVADLATTDQRRWAEAMAYVVSLRNDSPTHSYSAILDGAWSLPPGVAYLGEDQDHNRPELRRTLGDVYGSVGAARTALGVDAAALDGLAFALGDDLGWTWMLGVIFARRASLDDDAGKETRRFAVVRVPAGEWWLNRSLEIGFRTRIEGAGKKETRLRLLHPATVPGAVDTPEGIVCLDHLVSEAGVEESAIIRSFHAVEASSLFAWRSAINSRHMPAAVDPNARATFSEDGSHTVAITANNEITLGGGAVVPDSIKKWDWVRLSGWNNDSDREVRVDGINGDRTVVTVNVTDLVPESGTSGATVALHYNNTSILDSLWQPSGYRSLDIGAAQSDMNKIVGPRGQCNLNQVGITVSDLSVVGGYRRAHIHSQYDQPHVEHPAVHLVGTGWMLKDVLAFDTRGPSFFTQSCSPPDLGRITDVLGVFDNAAALEADEDSATAGGTITSANYNANPIIGADGLPTGWEDDPHMIAEGQRFGCVYDGKSTLGRYFLHRIDFNAFGVEDAECEGEVAAHGCLSFGSYMAGNDMNAPGSHINPRGPTFGEWRMYQAGIPAAAAIPADYLRHAYGTADVDDPRLNQAPWGSYGVLDWRDPLPLGFSASNFWSSASDITFTRERTVATVTDDGSGGRLAVGDSKTWTNVGGASFTVAEVTLHSSVTLPRVVREGSFVTFATGWSGVSGQYRIVSIAPDRQSFHVNDGGSAITAENVAAGGTLTFQSGDPSTAVSANTNDRSARCPHFHWKGRHYFEVTLDAAGTAHRWLVALTTSDTPTTGGDDFLGAGGFCFRNRRWRTIKYRGVDQNGVASVVDGPEALNEMSPGATVGLLYDADAGLVYVAKPKPGGGSSWLDATNAEVDAFADAQGWPVGNVGLPLYPTVACSFDNKSTINLGPRDSFVHASILPADVRAWDEAADVSAYRATRGAYSRIRCEWNYGTGHINGPNGARYGTFHAAGVRGIQYWFKTKQSYTIRWMEVDNTEHGPRNFLNNTRGPWVPDFANGDFAGFDDTLYPQTFGMLIEDDCSLEMVQLFAIKSQQKRLQGMGDGTLPPDKQTIPLDWMASIGRASPGRSHDIQTVQALDCGGISVRRTADHVHFGGIFARSSILIREGDWNPTGLANWSTIQRDWFAQAGIVLLSIHLGEGAGNRVDGIRAFMHMTTLQWSALVGLKGNGKLRASVLDLSGNEWGVAPILADINTNAVPFVGCTIKGTLRLPTQGSTDGLAEVLAADLSQNAARTADFVAIAVAQKTGDLSFYDVDDNEW